jgi:MerR family regulatory protein
MAPCSHGSRSKTPRIRPISLDSGPHSRLYDFVMATNHQIESTAMQIGEVAKRTSLTVDAIRFYEKRKLLPKAVRSAVGSDCTERAPSSDFTSSSKCRDSASHYARSGN